MTGKDGPPLPRYDTPAPAGGSLLGEPFISRRVAGLQRWTGFLRSRSGTAAVSPGVASKAAIAAFGDPVWQAQGLLWTGFAFAAGITVYFLLPEEPSLLVVGVLSLVALGLAVRSHRAGRGTQAGMLAAAVMAGVLVGSVRTDRVAAPKLGAETTATVTGFVLARTSSGGSDRIVLAVRKVDGEPAGGAFPEKIRIRVPADSPGRAGEAIDVRARLFPPAGPVRPGGYDFSFRAYYQGLGASGFSFGAPRPVDLGAPPVVTRVQSAVAGVRTGLADRILRLMGDRPAAGLAVALLVGDRSGIGEETEEALRQAGLAHVLAISGLHMALFAGGAFALVLALLSLSQALALKVSIHKAAAVIALGAATAYLLLSGGSIATQRSFLMIALVFVGVLCGRRGLTLRSVAIAGLVLLAAAPEQLFYPGFQMSFAAVICLVAVYERLRPGGAHDVAGRQVAGTGARLARMAFVWVSGLVVTAVVAGLATGLIGAHHFGRIAPYGLVGNVLGMPVFSILVMPMGVLALALMPFGLASVPLAVMGYGLDRLIDVANFAAGLSAGSGALPAPGSLATLLFVVSLFAALLLRGRRGLLCLVPVSFALVLVLTASTPDIQIANRGSALAARDIGGSLRLSSGRSSFQNALWLQAEGVPESALGNRKMDKSQRRCDRTGCVIRAFPDGPAGPEERQVKQGPFVPLIIALPRTQRALHHDCARADVIVTDLTAPQNCAAATVFDGSLRADRGAISIWLAWPEQHLFAEGVSPMVKPVITRIRFAKPRIKRPWHRVSG